jgi:hypothetical protein
MHRIIAAVVLFLLISASAAQIPPALNPDDPGRTMREAERRFQPLPYDQAAWYTAGRGGAGWFMSGVDPNASTRLTSATLFTYDESGNAAWTIGTAPRVAWPMTAAAIWSDAPWGVWRAEMVEGTNGACPTCAYAPSTFTASRFGAVEMTWTGPASIAVKLGGTDVGVVRPADLIVGASFADRIQGRHFASRRSVLIRSNGSRYVNNNKCLVDVAAVSQPVPAFTVDPTFRTNVVPASNARWYKLTADCVVTSSPLPAAIDPPTARQQVWYIALEGDNAPHAKFITLAENQIGRDAAGNAISFRFTRNTEVGRVFIDGPDSLSLHLAQLQDSTTVHAEWRISRSLPNPIDYAE